MAYVGGGGGGSGLGASIAGSQAQGGGFPIWDMEMIERNYVRCRLKLHRSDFRGSKGKNTPRKHSVINLVRLSPSGAELEK